MAPAQTRGNRRASRRLPPRGNVRVTCRRGTLDLGPNLAQRMLDVSETGVRLVLKAPLLERQEVYVTLEAMTGGLVRRTGRVVWSMPAADGAYLVGIRLE